MASLNSFRFRSFWGRTLLLCIVLSAILAIGWAVSSHEHFIRLAAVCYGYALGWIGGWVSCRSSKAM